MALLFIDGFDHYRDVLSKWDAATSNADGYPNIATTYSRRSGGRGCRYRYNSGPGTLTKTITPSGTVIVGMAFYPDTFAGSPDGQPFFQLREGTTVHMELAFAADGSKKIAVRRNGTVLGTSTTALALGTWYYLELKTTIHDTTGSFDLHMSGISEASGTNVDTRNGGTTGLVDNLYFVPAGFSSQFIDDIYVANGTGSVNNDFLGDCRVSLALPSGPGTHTDFDPPQTGVDLLAGLSGAGAGSVVLSTNQGAGGWLAGWTNGTPGVGDTGPTFSGNNAYLQVDFGSAVTIAGIAFTNDAWRNNGWDTDLYLQSSPDGTTWTERWRGSTNGPGVSYARDVPNAGWANVGDPPTGYSGWNGRLATPFSARYWRVRGVSGGSGNGWIIGQVSLYDDSAGGGPANWRNVLQSPADEDITYNASHTVGDTDTFPVAGLTNVRTIFGVQHWLRFRKSDAGSRQVGHVTRSGGTDYEDGGPFTVYDGYSNRFIVGDTNPATGLRWTAAELAAAEFGYKVKG